MGDVVLEINNVSKKYGKKLVIDNLSLKVNSGEIFGFLGPNGSGKTTTIKMIVGLLNIDNGNIYINGMDVVKNHEKAMENVGAIVENPDLYGYMPGIENLKLFARLHNVSNERLNEIIEMIGLKARIKDNVKKYSLGMKQRLGLGVALLHNPKLLILDEPTNGLDPAGIKSLRDILKNLAHKENMAVFVSSHLLSEMELMCDRVAIIDKGQIIKIVGLDEVKKETKEYIIATSDNAKTKLILTKICNVKEYENKLYIEYSGNISDIMKKILENGVEVYELRHNEKALEEEFLDVTGGLENEIL